MSVRVIQFISISNLPLLKLSILHNVIATPQIIKKSNAIIFGSLKFSDDVEGNGKRVVFVRSVLCPVRPVFFGTAFKTTLFII